MPDASDDNDDFLLVKAVVKGDKNAFRILIDRYEKLVVSIVFKMVSQKEDSEDLCQDVFLKVYEKLHTFKFQSRLSTWIGSIAFNTCINFLKKKKRIFLEDLQDFGDHVNELKGSHYLVADPELKPDERLLDKEKEEMVNKSIEQLPVIQKTILLFFHNNEMALLEISNITGLPLNTVKSHLFRARKQLKQELDKY